MTANTAALAGVWATYPASMATSEKLTQLNSKMVAGPAQDVSRAAIKGILSGNGVLASLQAYVANPAATQPALAATNYLLALISYEAEAVGDVLATSIPANLAMIEQISPNLLADPANGMTQSVHDQIMSLITPPIPWWKANGFSGPVLVNDLINAGNLF